MVSHHKHVTAAREYVSEKMEIPGHILQRWSSLYSNVDRTFRSTCKFVNYIYLLLIICTIFATTRAITAREYVSEKSGDAWTYFTTLIVVAFKRWSTCKFIIYLLLIIYTIFTTNVPLLRENTFQKRLEMPGHILLVFKRRSNIWSICEFVIIDNFHQ